jgi:nucleoside-diphosphate-sugar epimerase
MTTVLIAGSEGNFGPYLVRRLRETNPSWKLLRIKRSEGKCAFNAEKDRYEGDLRDPRLLEQVFSEHRIDHVIHAASQSYSHAGYRANPFQVLENDSACLLNVLRHSGSVSKLVYLSSALLYEHAHRTPLEEDDADRMPAPTSSYGAAKRFGESAVRMFGLERGVAYTIWRPFNIVSPLEPHNGEGRHVFVDFFRRLLVERVPQFSVLGSGNQVRCFIWVQDAANCVVDHLARSESNDQTFNLARDEPLTLLQLKDLLLELGRETGVLPDDYDPPTVKRGAFSGVESEVRIPSVAKLERVLGWKSTTTVRDCFRQFIEEKLRT